MDRATTGQADGERLVVGEAVGDPAPTTVVVVHRDRPKLLAASLEAWAAQTVPVRILLVDSGSTEEHHAVENSWTLALRAGGGERYVVEVGLVDGYAGSVRVRHLGRIEVSDSVGSE